MNGSMLAVPDALVRILAWDSLNFSGSRVFRMKQFLACKIGALYTYTTPVVCRTLLHSKTPCFDKDLMTDRSKTTLVRLCRKSASYAALYLQKILRCAS
jgi:hypothetical protein